jgi:hypothetical protein
MAALEHSERLEAADAISGGSRTRRPSATMRSPHSRRRGPRSRRRPMALAAPARPMRQPSAIAGGSRLNQGLKPPQVTFVPSAPVPGPVLAPSAPKKLALASEPTVGLRYYNPMTGRYISRDPLGYVDGDDNYLHVHNNPINKIDPLGLDTDDDKPVEKPKEGTPPHKEDSRPKGAGSAEDGARSAGKTQTATGTAKGGPEGKSTTVDVYVWDWRGPGVVLGSVGHVMVAEHGTKDIVVSQFPIPSGPSEPNVQKTFDETMAYEKGDSDHLYVVDVPDSAGMYKAAEDHETRPTWNWDPKGPNETHCARSAYAALQAGGVPLTGHDTGQLLPGNFGDLLKNLGYTDQYGPRNQARFDAVQPLRDEMMNSALKTENVFSR